MIIDLNINNLKTMIMNVYLDGNISTKFKQLDEIDTLLEEREFDLCILAGDFNIDLSKDNRDSRYLSIILEKYNLIDSYKYIHPNSKICTWATQDMNRSSCIDYIFIPEQFAHMISNTDIAFCPFSDHKAVKITLDLGNNIEKGPGYWKLNVSIFKDTKCMDSVKKCIEKSLSVKPNINDSTYPQWWKDLKTNVKTKCVALAKKKSANNRKIFNKLLDDLQEAEEEMMNFGSDLELSQRIAEIKRKIKEIENERLEGILLRSKTKWIKNDERPNSVFLKLEKSKAQQATIASLTKPSGQCIHTLDSILDHVKEYYGKLWNKENDGNLDDDNDLDTWVTKLPTDVLKLNSDLDLPFDADELDSLLSKTITKKSPGLDGLPYEFYTIFKDQLSVTLLEIYNAILDGIIHPADMDFNHSVTILLPKKGDTKSLDNWRPLSLSNCDGKILSKMIANRLYPLAPTFIGDHQNNLRGRSTTTCIRTLMDILRSNEKYSMVFIDQKKAFDLVNRKLILKSLLHLGLSQKLLNSITNLVSNTSTNVLVNGHLSDSFSTNRGVKQGDPLSPLLYDIAIETLLTHLSHRGKKNSEEISVIAYADDITVICNENNDLLLLNNILEKYSKDTGTVINSKKSFMISNDNNIDVTKTTLLSQIPLLESGTTFTYLGIDLNQNLSVDIIWSEHLRKFDLVLNQWKSRSLSLMGKIAVLNNLAFPQLIYPLQVASFDNVMSSKVNKLVREFIWNKGANLISLEKLKSPRKGGGLGLFDLDKVKNKLRWKTKLFLKHDMMRTWRNIVTANLNRSCDYFLGMKIFKNNLSSTEKRKFKKMADPFWAEVALSINPLTYLVHLVESKWSLSVPCKHGKGLFKMYPKHASTLFKYALNSLPMSDRFHSQLPLPPCWMCKNGPNDHEHSVSCSKAVDAWNIAKANASVDGEFHQGLVEAWSSKTPTLGALCAAATLHGLWWHRCSNLGSPITLQEAVRSNLNKII